MIRKRMPLYTWVHRLPEVMAVLSDSSYLMCDDAVLTHHLTVVSCDILSSSEERPRSWMAGE
jgi:hypothetical protein